MNAVPNRRGLFLGALTAGAAASMAAMPVIDAAEAPDPVLALVEAQKAGCARLLETEARTDDHEALEAPGLAVDAALEELLKTPPTTPAGAARLLNVW